MPITFENVENMGNIGTEDKPQINLQTLVSPKAKLLVKKKYIKFKRIIPQKQKPLMPLEDKHNIRSYIYYKDSEYEDLFIN